MSANGTGCAEPTRRSWNNASTSKISSRVPTPPGSAKNAVRSVASSRTPASTSPCFRAEKKLLVWYVSGGRYGCFRDACLAPPASSKIMKPATGLPASMPPRVTASIIPAPRPDHVVHSYVAATSRASARAEAKWGWSSGTRAEPRYTAPRPMRATTS